MKRSTLISTYLGFLTIALFLYSCEKEDFTPVNHYGKSGNKTWVYDSTFVPTLPGGNDSIGGGNPWDSLGGGTPGDTLGGGSPTDSIWFNPSTPSPTVWNPYDSTGGNNPGDTLGGGN